MFVLIQTSWYGLLCPHTHSSPDNGAGLNYRAMHAQAHVDSLHTEGKASHSHTQHIIPRPVTAMLLDRWSLINKSCDTS